MLNLLAQDFVLVSPETGEELLRIPRSATVATVVMRTRPGAPVKAEGYGGHGLTAIPTVDVDVDAGLYVEGFPALPEGPCEEPVIVSAETARVMRDRGLRWPGGVYSPQKLIFRDGRPLGAPGLIRHPDLALSGEDLEAIHIPAEKPPAGGGSS